MTTGNQATGSQLPHSEDVEQIGGLTLESEFEHVPVPATHRRKWRSVAAVWFGFPMILTCAIFGGVIAAFLGFWLALAAILIGNLVLFLYVGTLSYVAGETGLNFALMATRTFGRWGYTAASGFLALIVVGWFAFQTGLTGAILTASFGWNEALIIGIAGVLYIAITFIGIRGLAILGAIAAPLFVVLGLVAIGIVAAHHDFGQVLSYKGIAGAQVSALTFGGAVTIVIATFADSGTMTADFTRWARNGREAVAASFTAFPIAELVAMMFGVLFVAAGAVSNPTTDGGDFLPILASNGIILQALAVLLVFGNLGSVCTHCLYNGAVGWSHIVGGRMRALVIILGVIGVVVALLGVWSYFLTWLNILGVFVPPIGAVLIMDQVVVRRHLTSWSGPRIRPTAFVAWAAGAMVAGLVHFYAPAYADAVAGMLGGAIVYLVAEWVGAQPLFRQQPAVPGGLGQ